MRSPPPIAMLQAGVFTLAQAAAGGWTRSAIRHAVASDELLVVRRGVFALPPPPGERRWETDQALHRLSTAGALVARPGAIASHASAALLLGAPILDARAKPCVTVEPGAASALVGVHVHRARSIAPIYLGRLPLTPIEFAAVDTAREHGPAGGLVIADAALGNSLTTRTALEAAAEQRRGFPGVRIARWVVDFADPRAESPLESISRLGMHDHGLPKPEPQVEIWVDGRFIGRADFYWDEPGVIGEADGWDKYSNDWRKFRGQKRKDDLYERAGLVVVRWDSGEARDFASVATRIRGAFGRGAARSGFRRWTARRSQRHY